MVRCGTILLGGLWPGEIIQFTSYALAGFTLPTSSFFLTLPENYDLQLHHLMLHTLVLVAIFVHLCEMYVGVQPSVWMVQPFFALWASGRSANHLGAYYF
jgi:hypothetical protein